MALPSSGQLSLNDIRAELSAASTNVSLRSMSSTAGKSTPDAVSEFYGYSGISTGLSSALYTQNLSTSTAWDIFQGDNEISTLSDYANTTSRLVIQYINGTSGTSYQGDFQIGSIVYFGPSSYNTQYSTTNWQTTTTNTSTYSGASWTTLGTGTTSGRWNMRNTSAPPSSGTGLAPDTTVTNSQYYMYAETSGGSMLGYSFWLRSPETSMGSDPSLEFAFAHYGSNVGTFKVYIDVIST